MFSSVFLRLSLLVAVYTLPATNARTAYTGEDACPSLADSLNTDGVSSRLNSDWIGALDRFAAAVEAAEHSTSHASQLRVDHCVHRDRYHACVNLVSALLAVLAPRNLVVAALGRVIDANNGFTPGGGPWPANRSHAVVASLHSIAAGAYAIWGSDWDAPRLRIESGWRALLVHELLPKLLLVLTNASSASGDGASALLQVARASDVAAAAVAGAAAAPVLHLEDALGFADIALGMLEVGYVSGVDRWLAPAMGTAGAMLKQPPERLRNAAASPDAAATSAGRKRGLIVGAVASAFAACDSSTATALCSVHSAVRGPRGPDQRIQDSGSSYHHGADSSNGRGGVGILRLAFVSSDFRRHSVAYAMHGLLHGLTTATTDPHAAEVDQHGDHAQLLQPTFSVSCYATAPVDADPVGSLQWAPVPVPVPVPPSQTDGSVTEPHMTQLLQAQPSHPWLWTLASRPSTAKLSSSAHDVPPPLHAMRYFSARDKNEGARPIGTVERYGSAAARILAGHDLRLAEVRNPTQDGGRAPLPLHAGARMSSARGSGNMLVHRVAAAEAAAAGSAAAMTAASIVHAEDAKSSQHSVAAHFGVASALGECVPSAFAGRLPAGVPGLSQTHCIAAACGGYRLFALPTAVAGAGGSNAWLSQPAGSWSSADEEAALLQHIAYGDGAGASADTTKGGTLATGQALAGSSSGAHVVVDLNGRSVGSRLPALMRLRAAAAAAAQEQLQHIAAGGARLREEVDGTVHPSLSTETGNPDIARAGAAPARAGRHIALHVGLPSLPMPLLLSAVGSPLTSAQPGAGAVDFVVADACVLPPDLLLTDGRRRAAEIGRAAAVADAGEVLERRRRAVLAARAAAATAPGQLLPPMPLSSFTEAIAYLPCPYHPVTIARPANVRNGRCHSGDAAEKSCIRRRAGSVSGSHVAADTRPPVAAAAAAVAGARGGCGYNGGPVLAALHTAQKLEPRVFTVWVQAALRAGPCAELWLLRPQGVKPLSQPTAAAYPPEAAAADAARGGCIPLPDDLHPSAAAASLPSTASKPRCSPVHGEDIEAALRLEAAARGLHPSRLRFVGIPGGRDNRTSIAAGVYGVGLDDEDDDDDGDGDGVEDGHRDGGDDGTDSGRGRGEQDRDAAGTPPQLPRRRRITVMLDAAAWGAHSTAADMLAAGIPVLTMTAGEWPSRVAAAFLTAVSRESRGSAGADGKELQLARAIKSLLVAEGLGAFEESGVRLAESTGRRRPLADFIRPAILHPRRDSPTKGISNENVISAVDAAQPARHFGRAVKAAHESSQLTDVARSLSFQAGGAFHVANSGGLDAADPGCRLPHIVVL